MLILNLCRLSTSTGLGKVSQLFLGEPENSKISNYLYCCDSYRPQLNAEQGPDTLPAWAAYGDARRHLLRTPTRSIVTNMSHCSRATMVFYHQKKKLSLILAFNPAFPRPHQQAVVAPVPRCVHVKPTPPWTHIFFFFLLNIKRGLKIIKIILWMK